MHAPPLWYSNTITGMICFAPPTYLDTRIIWGYTYLGQANSATCALRSHLIEKTDVSGADQVRHGVDNPCIVFRSGAVLHRGDEVVERRLYRFGLPSQRRSK